MLTRNPEHIVMHFIIDTRSIQGIVKLVFYDVASGSRIMPCIKIDEPLMVYRFSGHNNVAYCNDSAISNSLAVGLTL